MTYGEAFDFCMAGGRVRATQRYSDGTIRLSLFIWYYKEKDVFVHKKTDSDNNVVSYDASFLQHNETMSALSKWTFEDADPKPTFGVRAEVDDDSALCVSIFWRGGLVIGTDRDDAIQLFEALGRAIRCEPCGEYLDANGKCDAGKHDGSK